MTSPQSKITIVTPSYNQGQFLEETIQSVLGQCYPNLEYIVMDGGSTDNSVEIIKKYEKHLAHWVSEKDGGQSAAINAGFGRATGDILGWLNSDDMYLPGALSRIASHLDPSKPEIVFGNCLHISENNKATYGSDVEASSANVPLTVQDYIIQPSAFWTKAAWKAVGILDADLTYGFDWDWFLRAEKQNVVFSPIAKYLSVYRLHEAHKTGTGGDKRQEELAAIYEKYAGKRYKDLYIECCRSGPAAAKLAFWMRRFRLGRVSEPVLRLKFPKLFGAVKPQEVWAMLEMR
jgi:glycosyltransferase involved in cell wall biosynthesis